MASLVAFRRLTVAAVKVAGSNKAEGGDAANCWAWRGESPRRRVSTSSFIWASSSSSSKYIQNGTRPRKVDKIIVPAVARIKHDLHYGGGSVQLTAGFKSCAGLLNQNTELEKEAAKRDKVLKVKLRSKRVDAILKAGLSMSRNKIEKALYEDRIRLNGTRPKKKSQTVEEGDEVDIVRGYNKLNPEFLDVSRVEVEELGEEEEEDSDDSGSEDDEAGSKIPAVLRRSKLLTIKNYSPPWKGKSGDD